MVRNLFIVAFILLRKFIFSDDTSDMCAILVDPTDPADLTAIAKWLQ